ncbi:YlbF/YmcA family competence regulator, partial [Streptococcus agalactiae]|nr:YlbF/YmcA family competence regulator [Streptococcus agalactiae]MCC9745168.1 YlbF/YmcA family competence regulator [Streptococcus agalactiae]
MANVYDLANELERAVRALPEYQAVLTAKAAIENDADAQVLWQDFLATQSKVQEMMQSGQMPSQEEQDEMSKLGEKIESNDLLKVYFDQQQRLSVYMSDIEKIVFAPMQDLMLKKQFGNFGEKSRKVRVKMRKSGKHWVKSVMTQIGYVILSRFSGKEKSSKVQTTSEDLSRTKTSASILTAVAALGAVVGGTTDTTSVSAEETPTATELTGNEKTLATAETVVVAPEVKTVNSDSSSHSTSESQSMSTSTLQSTSASLSASESLMDSTSASLSESSSLSEYSSLSLSSSESVSASESVQSSEAATTARVQPRAMRVVSSASDMETLPAALISGEGDVTTVQGQDVTDKLQNLDIKLSGGVQAKAGVINMDKSESMHMSLKFTIDSVNRGDT